jgi:hypothetical protein
MNFKIWLVNETLEILNRTKLFDLGMSGNTVNGEIIQCLDGIRGSDFNMAPGKIAVLIKEEPEYYIIALAMGMMGFQPFKTKKSLWQKTGKKFSGNVESFESINNFMSGMVDMEYIKPVIDRVVGRFTHDVRKVFETPNSVRIILRESPKGTNGYRSPYQVLIQLTKPELVSITIITRNQTRTMHVEAEPRVLEPSLTGAMGAVTDRRLSP